MSKEIFETGDDEWPSVWTILGRGLAGLFFGLIWIAMGKTFGWKVATLIMGSIGVIAMLLWLILRWVGNRLAHFFNHYDEEKQSMPVCPWFTNPQTVAICVFGILSFVVFTLGAGALTAYQGLTTWSILCFIGAGLAILLALIYAIRAWTFFNHYNAWKVNN